MFVKRARFLDPKADVVFKKIFGQHPDLSISKLMSGYGLSKASVYNDLNQE
jgi:hypothetical protein